jgi:hypothetical protein
LKAVAMASWIKYTKQLHFIEEREHIKIDLLLICGDFQAVRNRSDLEAMAVPKKFQKMNTFWKSDMHKNLLCLFQKFPHLLTLDFVYPVKYVIMYLDIIKATAKLQCLQYLLAVITRRQITFKSCHMGAG